MIDCGGYGDSGLFSTFMAQFLFMKNVLLVFLLLASCRTVFSQITEKYYGTAARSEIVLDSKLTFAKGTISVGYSFSPATATNTDCLVFLADSTGNVIWQKELATPNTDKYYAVVQTYDSNFVAVGAVNATSFYNGNVAIVTKFSQTGAVLWEKQFKNTSPGEVLYDVIEMPGNHHIVATGSYNFSPGINSGLLIDLDNVSGTPNWMKTFDYTGSNQFYGLAAINSSVYVVGFYQGTTFYDGYLVSVNELNGNMNWSRRYDYTSILFPGTNCNWFQRIQSYNNEVYINTTISNDYVASASTSHAVIKVDTTGGNPVCLEMRKPGFNYCNDNAAFMYGNRLYTVQHPANTQYSPMTGTGLGSYTEATLAKISTFNAAANPQVYCKKIGNTGDQAVYSLNVANGKLLCSGLSLNDPGQIGNIDVFSLKSDTTLGSNNNCILLDTTLLYGNPQVLSTNFSFTAINNALFTNNPIAMQSNSIALQNVTICYDSLKVDSLQAGFVFQVPDPCDSTSYQFTDASIAGNSTIVSWNWNFGDTGTSGSQNPNHQYSTAGTYTVTLIVTSNTGKIDTFVTTVVAVNNFFTLTATANPSTICQGQSTTLLGSGTTNYSWTGGVSNGIPFIPGSTSTYTVTGSDGKGCSKTTSVTVTVLSALSVSVTPPFTVLCLGDQVQLTATGATTYTWSPNQYMNSNSIPDPVVSPPVSTTYTVLGTDASGCTGTATATIDIVTDPTLTVTKSGDVECHINTVQLMASGAATYTWSPATFLSDPNSFITNATITEPTTFVVVGTVGSCVVTDSIRVNVYNNDESAMFIPNAFSPNGDGNNDCLRVVNSAKFTSYYFAIYNRWGQRVFESETPTDCWNGEFRNEPAATDTYYYFMKGETRCGKVFKKGDVLLIR